MGDEYEQFLLPWERAIADNERAQAEQESEGAQTMDVMVDQANPVYSFPWVATSGLEETFLVLAEQWQRETGMLSLVQKMVMHPAYQRIIGMGQPVVPLILRELEREPDHWFWALEAITGANPVLPEQRGRLDEMAAAWLSWGRSQGYRW